MKQKAIKARQELEFNERLEKIENKIMFKNAKTVYKSNHSLKKVNRELFNAHSQQLN